jgi:hypothetical protein
MAPKKKGAADKGKGKATGSGGGERPKWVSAELWALCSNMPALVAALGGGEAAKAPPGVSRAEVSWQQGATALAHSHRPHHLPSHCVCNQCVCNQTKLSLCTTTCASPPAARTVTQ